MNTRAILAAVILALGMTACSMLSTDADGAPPQTAVVDMVITDYATWLAENPTGTFEQYRPQAVRNLLSRVGVDYEGDAEAALMAWLGDTPVSGDALRRASLIVIARPELAEYRVVIAQVFARLGT